MLIALLENGELPIMDLPKKAKLGGSAVYNAVRWLEDKELIEDQREKNPPRRRMMNLTEKGRKIAVLLQQIEKEL